MITRKVAVVQAAPVEGAMVEHQAVVTGKALAGAAPHKAGGETGVHRRAVEIALHHVGDLKMAGASKAAVGALQQWIQKKDDG